jgi:GntR family transcriptional repressor for pyruvate dehydrogenase complex
MLFEDLKINRNPLYEQMAQYVEEMVSSGKLQAGDKLPPERELAASMSVSRTVVREAIKALAERGLVAIQPGQGVFVSAPNSNQISNQLARLFRLSGRSNDDLLAVRRILEVEIAGLAAGKGTDQELQDMRKAIDVMEEHIDSAESYVAADQDFHAALARATGNEILPILIEAFVDRLQESRRMIFRVHGAPQRGQVFHHAIYNAVTRGDAQAAREAMQQHLIQVEEDSKAGQQLSDLDGH